MVYSQLLEAAEQSGSGGAPKSALEELADDYRHAAQDFGGGICMEGVLKVLQDKNVSTAEGVWGVVRARTVKQFKKNCKQRCRHLKGK